MILYQYNRDDYELLALAIDSGDMATIIDAAGTIRYIGKRYASILGIEQEEMLGKPIADIIPNTRMLQVLKSGEPEYGCVFLVKDQEPIVVDRYPIWDKDGNIRGVACVNSFSDVDSVQKLQQTIQRLEREREYYRRQIHEMTSRSAQIDSIAGSSFLMQQLKNLVAKAAKSELTVLITGETGCGKEVFSDAIHQLSGRRTGPFVKINCAAIPKDLLESELFGYEEGAFSGASRKGKPGKFELANGGTILLDEIGEMSLQLQAKLLRVLQERQIERVGGLRPISFDARIVCSTNRDLLQMVKEGTFRQDLYYRINIVELHIPSLRERKEDIPELCDFLIKKIDQRHGCHVEGVDPGVLQLFERYDWPGNVRELEHVLERACVFSTTGELQAESFDFFVQSMSRGQGDIPAAPEADGAASGRKEDNSLSARKERLEKEAIVHALSQTGGNKSKAAKLLGMTRGLLYVKLEKYQIKP